MVARLVALLLLLGSSVVVPVDGAYPSMRAARIQTRTTLPSKPVAATIRYYHHWLGGAGAIVLLLAGASGYVLWLNARLRQAKRYLETEVADRRRAEQALRRSERTLRALHGITAMHERPLTNKIQALLAFGSQQFRLPVGILSRVDGEDYQVQEIVAPNSDICRGAVFPLSRTFCCNTLQSEEPLGFEHAAACEWRRHPAYEQRPIEAYLGMRVRVDSAVYGTLNFVSTEPRLAAFTNTDKEVLRLMAQWVGNEIERDRAEAQMRRLSGALEQTADAVAIVGRDGRIEYVNPAFERATGYSRAEALGRSPRILQSGRHDADFYRRLWQTILAGEVFNATFINRRRDGALYYEEKTITPLRDAAGEVTCFVSTGRDVTQRQLAEEEARHRQAQLAHVCRVSAMGEMATALAHELNQPLAAIVNYARGTMHRLAAGDLQPRDVGAALDRIAHQANQSAEIVRRVRGFLCKGESRRRPTDINDVVREAVELAALEARSREVTIALALAPGLPPVLADTIQIEQVVLNLVHNAVDAIDQAHWPLREVTVHTANADQRVEVTVADTGPGFGTDMAERIFEAFFTTKPDGMGMGLSISRSIIETHGDTLQVTASPGGGAAFRFGLPVVERGPDP